MEDLLFALVPARLEHRQTYFQGRLAPLAIMSHGAILGSSDSIKIFQLHLQRAIPLGAWNFRPATARHK